MSIGTLVHWEREFIPKRLISKDEEIHYSLRAIMDLDEPPAAHARDFNSCIFFFANSYGKIRRSVYFDLPEHALDFVDELSQTCLTGVSIGASLPYDVTPSLVKQVGKLYRDTEQESSMLIGHVTKIPSFFKRLKRWWFGGEIEHDYQRQELTFKGRIEK